MTERFGGLEISIKNLFIVDKLDIAREINIIGFVSYQRGGCRLNGKLKDTVKLVQIHVLRTQHVKDYWLSRKTCLFTKKKS